MISPACTSKAPKDESYPDFQKRVAEDEKRVRKKCAKLDQFIPRCTWCGETCNPCASGKACKENGSPMISRWAEEKAKRDWHVIGHFGPGWSYEKRNLAAIYDRIRADALADGKETT